MDNSTHNSYLVPTTHEVGNAVGMPEAHWFIARMVRNNTEKKAARLLSKLGYDNYVATQQQLREWKNGRRVKTDIVVIPSVVFVHCTEAERRKIVTLPFISRFMTDRAAAAPEGMHKPVATVSDSEMDQLKFMLGVPDARVSFVDHFVKGQKVRVVRGPFKNLTGEILNDPNGKTSRLYLNIECLGAAYVEINTLDVKPL
ncbi:MAG: UpxY family transcription antiterminator [Bacteroides sp.]|nr:UpxY family transcription antiterminator [Bacteroides sp.]